MGAMSASVVGFVTFVVALVVPALILLLILICNNGCCCFIIKEKHAVVKETCGVYKETLGSGVHYFCPCVSRQVEYRAVYFASKMDQMTRVDVHEKMISQYQQSVDFPKFEVITRDNVKCTIDMTVNYKVTSPADVVYNVTNMPYMLQLLINAIVRSKCGQVELEQLIEDPKEISMLQGDLQDQVRTWGITIELFKVQKVEASNELNEELYKAKQERYQCDSDIKQALTTKQGEGIYASAYKNKLIQEAIGAAQQIQLTAAGEAEAIKNKGNAQAKAIQSLISGMGNKAAIFYIANKTCDLIAAINAASTTQVMYTHGVDKYEVAKAVLGCYMLM